MSIGDLVNLITNEWPVIAEAPWSFATAVLIVATLLWIAMQHLYRHQIGDLQERVRLRDDQIADYQAKLGDAPADEIKQKIEALESKIASMRPRE